MLLLLQTLRLGIYSLLLHRLRSGLAVLGILIGVTAVIWLVALGEGVSHQAQQQIKDLGASNIIIRSVKPAQTGSKGGRSGMFLEYGLKRADFGRIMSNVPSIDKAVPMRQIKFEVRNDDRTIEATVVGCTTDYFELNHLTMFSGRFLEATDGEQRLNVCVLASNTARTLFPLDNPVGKTVQIGSDFYRVIGETASRDPSAAIGGSLESKDYNNDVYIPLEALRWRIGDTVFTSRSGSREGEIVELSQITISINDTEKVDESAAIIKHLLSKYHPLEDVGVVVPKELLRQAKLLQIIFNVLLVLIAGISLLVGGIGIMNIMLATVTERTREIGIRRALGATRSNVIYQFLIEAVVLTGVGGGLGVLIGFLVGPVVHYTRVFAQAAAPEVIASLPENILKLEPRVAPWSILASLFISIGVGVLFGLYPAYRAAMMDPIEALRHE